MRRSAGLTAPGLARGSLGLLAALALLSAAALALLHPVAPVAALAGVWLVALGVAWRPRAWLFWLPALMPLLSAFPWTGWWLLDESDLFVLAVLAGGYGRWAWDGRTAPMDAPPRWLVWAGGALALCVTQAAWRGWASGPALPPFTSPADAFWQGLFADPVSAWNSPRVAKSFVWALLLAPLAWRAVALGRAAAGQAFVRGMVAGLVVVVALVLWERGTQVGLLDFVSDYRTSAAFWEMHVGGGAIDMHLALTAPLALWAAWVASTRGRFWLALGLLWLGIYAVLTTYSRGVMGAFIVAVLGWALATRHFHLPHDGHGPGRRRVVAATLIGLLVQGALVLGSGVFLGNRLEATSKDLLGRWAHWERGLSLLRTPGGSVWWGLGMGRFVERYRGLAMEGELPGRAEWRRSGPGEGALWIGGPDSRGELALYFGLLQRVTVSDRLGHTARIRLAGVPGDRVRVALCRRHLLHTRQCQWASATVQVDDPEGLRWQTIRLAGAPMWAGEGARRYAGVPAVLSLHATAPGQRTRVPGIDLRDPRGQSLLLNGDFARGLAHWMPAAEAYYQPWHTDNLYLDLLLELGLVGAGVVAGLAVAALLAVHRGLRGGDGLAWAYAASLLAMLALGVFISATEIPRVMLLALLTGFLPLTLWTKRRTEGL